MGFETPVVYTLTNVYPISSNINLSKRINTPPRNYERKFET